VLFPRELNPASGPLCIQAGIASQAEATRRSPMTLHRGAICRRDRNFEGKNASVPIGKQSSK
jgi:hypothetical protein